MCLFIKGTGCLCAFIRMIGVKKKKKKDFFFISFMSHQKTITTEYGCLLILLSISGDNWLLFDYK